MEPDGWRPANSVEHALLAAMARGDVDEYRGVLGSATIWLPQPTGLGRGDTGDSPWPTGVADGRAFVIGCTSIDTMRQTLGHDHARAVPFPDLAYTWPHPTTWFAVNLGTPLQALFDAEAVARTAQRTEQTVHPVEAALRAAVNAGDHTRFALTLLACDLALPTPPDGRPGAVPGDAEFAWWRASTAEGVEVAIAYTSRQRLLADLGDVPHVTADLPQVLAAWPDADLGLAVNPGMPVTGVVSGSAMIGLAAWVARVGDAAQAAAAAAAARTDIGESEREYAAYAAARERVAELLRA